MIERRHPIELYAVELEKARAGLSGLLKSRVARAFEINNAAVRVKELEVRLASARLAQAEYYLSALKSRVGYLEARTARPDFATPTEEQELAWASEALPSNNAAVASLAQELSQLRQQLRTLAAQAAA